MTKVGITNAFYCILLYRPPGPAQVFLKDFAGFLTHALMTCLAVYKLICCHSLNHLILINMYLVPLIRKVYSTLFFFFLWP